VFSLHSTLQYNHSTYCSTVRVLYYIGSSLISAVLWFHCDYALPRCDYASFQFRQFFDSIATNTPYAVCQNCSTPAPLLSLQLVPYFPILAVRWFYCDYALPRCNCASFQLRHTPYAVCQNCSTPAPLDPPLWLRISTLWLHKFPIASFLWIHCEYTTLLSDYNSFQFRQFSTHCL
jgi:hypothetical protein